MSFPVGGQVEYAWESLDGWSAVPAGYHLKSLVIPAPVQAEAGRVYRLRLTSKFAGSDLTAVSEVGRPDDAGMFQFNFVRHDLRWHEMRCPAGFTPGHWLATGRTPAWAIW